MALKVSFLSFVARIGREVNPFAISPILRGKSSARAPNTTREARMLPHCHSSWLHRLWRKGSNYLFEARISAQRIPLGALFKFAVTDTVWERGGGRELLQRCVLLAAPGVNRGEIRDPDRADPGILGEGKNFTRAFPFPNCFFAPAQHGIGETKITPGLGIIGLLMRGALKNRAGRGQGRLRQGLIAEKPCRSSHAIFPRDSCFVEAVGNPFGRNQRHRFFRGGSISLDPAAKQKWKRDAACCLVPLRSHKVELLSPGRDVRRLSE